jgi:hypothetical protein
MPDVKAFAEALDRAVSVSEHLNERMGEPPLLQKMHSYRRSRPLPHRSRCRSFPMVSSPSRQHPTILVQPSLHLTETAAESSGWNAVPDPHRKPTLGVGGRLLRGPHRASRPNTTGRAGARESRSRRSRPLISMLPSSVNCRRRTFRSAMSSRRVRCRW